MIYIIEEKRRFSEVTTNSIDFPTLLNCFDEITAGP